jgi:peptide/nickel transport system permease protein
LSSAAVTPSSDLPLAAPTPTAPVPAVAARRRLSLARLVSSPMGAIGAILLGLNLLLVLVGPYIAPYPDTEFHQLHAFEGPSAQFWFGTDEFGRDVFSRVLHGARPTLVVAAFSTLIGVAVGTVIGLAAGYYGGRTDELLMRIMDALMSFPTLILAMLIITMLGPNPVNVVLSVALVFFPRAARVVRSVALQLSTLEFVDAARVRGESDRYILFREILPNAWNVITVELSIRLSYSILLAASLAFLGVGYAPPSPAWGLMVKEGKEYLQLAPWLVIFPSIAVASASIGAVLFADSVKQLLAFRGGVGE